MKKFLYELLKSNSLVSSNRFLGIFIYTPVLIIMIFTGIGIEYVLAIIGLITALLITNAISKHRNFEKNPYNK